MQTQNVEPGTNVQIARYFGLMFLLEAICAFLAALAEQFYDGAISLYLAVAAMLAAVLAVCVCIPAALAVCMPQPMSQSRHLGVAFITGLAVFALAVMLVAPNLQAAPALPLVAGGLRRDLLALGVVSAGVLTMAVLGRLMRFRMKGRNGAFILLIGLVVAGVVGAVWMWLEPMCRLVSEGQVWPDECPLPMSFDHNFMMVAALLVCNVLAAEGVLRLMAAGTGTEGYVEIIPVIAT